MPLTDLDLSEEKLLHPFANKVRPGEWFKIFWFENNPVKIWVRAMTAGAVIMWFIVQRDWVPFAISLLIFFLWDVSAMVYWRRRAVFHRNQLEKTAEEMMKINKEIEEKQKYFERKKLEYLEEHPEEK